MAPEEAVTPADVATLLCTLYGSAFSDDGHPAPGIIHIAATYRPHRDRARVNLVINDATPHNPYDGFALAATRARADAIITTGKILRSEPNLQHDDMAGLVGTEAAKGLAAWRRDVAGHRDGPIVLVLTSGKRLPLAHPALHRRAPTLIFCPPEAAQHLPQQLAKSGAAVVSDARTDIASAIQYLRRTHGCRSIVIEAGPSTSSKLYGDETARTATSDAPMVTELLLTTLHLPSNTPHTPALSDRALGGPFIAEESIAATVPHAGPVSDLRPSAQDTWHGHWHFQRFTAFPQGIAQDHSSQTDTAL